MFDEYDDVVTIEDLCTMLHIGTGKAYRLMKSGKIKVFKMDRVWKIPKSSVIEYVRNMSTQGA